MRAIKAEFGKLKGSRVPLWTALAVVAYALVAVAGGIAMKNGQLSTAMGDVGGAWTEAFKLGYYSFTWNSLLRENVQAIAGNLGLLLFGFVAAYVFGRERKEGTEATLLTSPVQRRSFALAKLGVVAVWAFALTLLSFALQTLAFAALGPEGFSWKLLGTSFGQSLGATLMLVSLLPWVGLVALLGKPGYLKPMLATVVLMSTGNVFVMSEYAHLFPSSMPMLYAGASWMPVVDGQLTALSWVVVALSLVLGSAALMWKIGRAGDARA